MIRRTWVLPLVTGVLIGGILFSPMGPLTSTNAAAGTATSLGDSFGLNFRGHAKREPTAADHFQYSNPLYSMATGEQVGTATHHVFFTEKPGVLDHTMTFRLPGGDIVSHQLESVGQDTQYPPGAKFLIGIHPDGKSIDPDRSTGAYKGRTGKLRMKGWHDTTKFPAEATFDDFYWIDLDPK
jgi:hypothetical protein